MRSVVTVTAANADKQLTTLARVKLELSLSGADTNRDMLLNLKIDEASDDIEAALGFKIAKETVSETFWPEPYDMAPDRLVLDRTPVGTISSVTVDGVAYDASLYRLDAGTGELFALDASGYACRWYFCKSVVVAYSGGYILPAESGADLPAGIEGACVDLVSSFWASKGRDPTVKSEEVPGVLRTDYWVGAVGEAGELPPSVVMKLAPFRRAIA